MNSTEISTDLTPAEEQELIEGFKSLVVNKSVTMETLEKLEKFISKEVERLSESGNSTTDDEENSDNEDSDDDDDQYFDADYAPIALPKQSESIEEGIEVTPDINLPTILAPNCLMKSLTELIDHRDNFFTMKDLHPLKAEINRIFSYYDTKYIWMSNKQCTYKFGSWSLESLQINLFKKIINIMNVLNDNMGLNLDSCLITRYINSSDMIPRHQDNEDIIDQEHAICNVSIGSPREIEFWTTGKERTGTLIKNICMQEGSLVVMKPGCQQRTWHKVLKGVIGTRFCLSFRKANPLAQPLTPEICKSVKFAELVSAQSTPLSSKCRLTEPVEKPMPMTDAAPVSSPTTPPPTSPPTSPPPTTSPDRPASSNPPTPPGPHPPTPPPPTPPLPIPPPPAKLPPNTLPPPPSIPLPKLMPLLNGFPVHPDRLPNVETYIATPPAQHQQQMHSPLPQNLLIGDSMVKGLQVPNTIKICKGGIHPRDVLGLLPGSTDILPPQSYDNIRTVTLIVGTNAINVNGHSKPTPLLEVIADYKALVSDLHKLFPNARLGLLNIIPRTYTCRETLFRIEHFNSLFSRHICEIVPGVVWIRLYWEFVNDYGYLRQDLYGKDGLHLNFRGKKLMSRAIISFQQSFY